MKTIACLLVVLLAAACAADHPRGKAQSTERPMDDPPAASREAPQNGASNVRIEPLVVIDEHSRKMADPQAAADLKGGQATDNASSAAVTEGDTRTALPKTGDEALAEPLGIERAVAVALKSNPKIDEAVARIRRSEAIIDEAVAAFWPTLSFYTEFITGDAPSVYAFKKLDERKLPLDIDFNEPGPFRSFGSGWRTHLSLFRGGRNVLRKEKAETGLDISELGLQTVKNALIASTVQAYYTALAARDYVDIARQSVKTTQTQLEDVRVRYRGGSALKSDVLSLQVRLARARADLIKARNHRQLTLSALANLLGMHPDEPLELADPRERLAGLPQDYETGMARALSVRPELIQARRRIAASKMGVDMERGAYLPTLDFQAEAYFSDGAMQYTGDRVNWTAGMGFNWDLFTGLGRKARVEKAQAVVDEMIAADREATLSVQLDVKRAYLQKAEAEARLEVARARVAQAREALHLVEKEYRGGSATVTRYLDAELACNAARMEETAARYDLRKAEADIGRAVGYLGSGNYRLRKPED